MADSRVRLQFVIRTPAEDHFWAIHALMCPWPICTEARPKQLERHAYPGQPSTRAEHVPPPCLCTYHPFGFGAYLNLGSCFEIHPACRHHGHLANTHLIERMWDDPYGYGVLRDPYDLDDERR